MGAYLNVCWELQSLNDAIIDLRGYWAITGCRKEENSMRKMDLN
jgi:hypothetical protein